MSGSTLADVADSPPGRSALWGRRSFLCALLALVLAGGTGLLGVHTRTTHARGSGYDLEVTYAGTARAGLDVPVEITVHHAGGFGKQLVIGITGAYFDIFETQGFTPDPSSATRDADRLLLTFDAPAGETFTFSYDAYIQPSSQQGGSATISVIDGGAVVVATEVRTRLWP